MSEQQKDVPAGNIGRGLGMRAVRVLATVVLLTFGSSSGLSAAGAFDHTQTSAAETRQAYMKGDILALRFAGRVANVSTDPGHWRFNGEVQSLATGEVVGTLTHELSCLGTVSLPCPVVDVVDRFQFAGGALVSRAKESIALDPGHPGFALIGIHPEGKTIVEATGALAGRTGRAQMSGHHDGRDLPGYATFDDFWLIELDPKS